MTVTVAAVAVAAWLVLQIPMGMAIGCYIRHARLLAEAQPRRTAQQMHRPKRHPLDRCPPAVFLGS